MVQNFFDKKTRLVRTSKKRANLNEFVQELHKPVIENFKRRKVKARFRENVWVKDLGKKRSFPSKNWGVKYLLCVVDVFMKYAWVKPLKEKLAETLLSGFVGTVNESKCKPNKLQVDRGRELYNTPMQNWLHENDILIKSVGAEWFVKTLKGKIFQKFFGSSNKLVDEYNNAYRRSSRRKPI